MYGAIVGLEIGKRALLTEQLMLKITGHNIANVNTPGYSCHRGVPTSNLPLLMQFDTPKQSIEGVSLAEEMANMIQHHHAYEAAARLISTMDSSIDTVINGMGASA